MGDVYIKIVKLLRIDPATRNKNEIAAIKKAHWGCR
jgi:hypothetical protein